jgi:hypothetical protein
MIVIDPMLQSSPEAAVLFAFFKPKELPFHLGTQRYA